MDAKPIELTKEFGERVKALRESRNMRQEVLAKKAGTSPTTMSSIERGETATNLNLIFGIANALKVHPARLFGDVEISPLDAWEIVGRALRGTAGGAVSYPDAEIEEILKKVPETPRAKSLLKVHLESLLVGLSKDADDEKKAAQPKEKKNA